MELSDIEQIEIPLLVEAVYQRYGHDFRNYAPSTVERRIRSFLTVSGCRHISEMIPRLLHEEGFFQQFLKAFSITVTEMFRDPAVYRCLREKVLPVLASYPFIRIWIAGCATGEEAYSLAILLEEEGLYDRTTLFATDFNDEALARARAGIYPLDRIRLFTRNYQEAGGIQPFSNYCHARYDAMAVCQPLKRNITFANHNLVTDGVFGEMHLILCRNVLIYFDRALQGRVLSLFRDSLDPRGYLCLGSAESLHLSAIQDCFEAVDEEARVFRRRRIPRKPEWDAGTTPTALFPDPLSEEQC